MIDPDLRMWCYQESKNLVRSNSYGLTSLKDITDDAEKLYEWITKNREHYDLKPPIV